MANLGFALFDDSVVLLDFLIDLDLAGLDLVLLLDDGVVLSLQLGNLVLQLVLRLLQRERKIRLKYQFLLAQ